MTRLVFFRICVLLLLIFLIESKESSATHIKAADLYATINPDGDTSKYAYRKVRFTLTVYCRIASVDISGPNSSDCGQLLGNCIVLDFGDGSNSDQVKYKSKIALPDGDTYQFIYEVDHIYTTDKTFIVYYQDENRNNNILNLKGPTEALPFYVEMGITIESGLGQNQTPKMSIFPIDNAEIYRLFKHNPGASDVNGDSISYFPYEPYIAPGFEAPGYQDPNVRSQGSTQDGTAAATYSVNSLNGDVIWNAPADTGLFNIAFVIEEWRTFGKSKQRLSYTVRDMQIHVRGGINHQPQITVPSTQCVVAGGRLSKDIFVKDPDGDKVRFDFYGELSEDRPHGNKATFTPTSNPISTPGIKNFSWITECSDVRKRPYQAFFKATDLVAVNSTSPSLTDIESFFIYVVGPKPTGLVSNVVNDSILLRWNSYACKDGRPGAYRMQVYRRVGCDTSVIGGCQTDALKDYTFLGEVPISDTTFTDKTAKRGNVYSYRIMASFIDEVGLLSYSVPSDNHSCISLPLIVPIITKVSYVGPLKDSIEVDWDRPIELDTSKIQGPYTYFVLRTRQGENNYVLLDTVQSPVLSDGSYVDAHVDTSIGYTYVVSLKYYAKQSLTTQTDSSEPASRVFLQTVGVAHGVSLTWQAETPWVNSIDTSYHHLVWRKRATDTGFVLIAKVSFDQNTTTYTYTDLGTPQDPLKEKEEIAYYVTTAGSYRNEKITPDTIYNNSFISRSVVLDVTPPCPPTLDAIVYDCFKFTQTYPYYNNLSWFNPPYSASCDSDIVAYKLYYAAKRSQTPALLLELPDTTYKHMNLSTVSGCYVVTALDATGNESGKSNLMCVEPCKLYELPNVFTPNNSGDNEIFRPLAPSPLSVESVEFKVFNRWGQKVFEKNDDIHLNWDGAGLPDGVYFYSAKVYFVTVEDQNVKELKGWVQILR